MPEQTGGDLAAVGEEMIEAATELNGSAQAGPHRGRGGPARLPDRAIERGAEGIHTDLSCRVNTAARFSPEGLLPAEFERTFGTGYAAGLESG